MSRFIAEELNNYAEQHSTPEPEVLQELARETEAKYSKPQMLSGHLQGLFLKNMVALMGAQNVLEIGTYTGYSAISMGLALPENGILTTIDVNDELQMVVEHYIKKAGLQDKIIPVFENAVDFIPHIEGAIDLVFIDADKQNYSRYYDLVFEKVRPGGVILADNVLWSGKVLNEESDKDTRAIQEFNIKVNSDDRVENTLLPVRDGLMLCRKIA